MKTAIKAILLIAVLYALAYVANVYTVISADQFLVYMTVAIVSYLAACEGTYE